jgi:ubiquinol-cytochrome c reductase cytochrome c1 subunit
MKKLLIIAFAVLFAPVAMAAGGSGYHLDKVDIDLNNKESLQRGARLFVNYCLNCHSAGYARYNRVAADLGISEEAMSDNMIFTTDANGDKSKVGSLMKVAMSERYAKEAFGTKIPDLTLVARVRGTDWLYTYLRTFYMDDSRPMGVNNAVFADVGMPHVLWELQGFQKAVKETTVDDNGNEHTEIVGFETVKPGSMSGPEYDQAMRDLVGFLAYMGEPIAMERQRLGLYVLLFLALLFVVSYFMKKEYWKDIH